MEAEKPDKGVKKEWLKKLGILGFMFFLIKGVIWIGVAIYAWWHIKK